MTTPALQSILPREMTEVRVRPLFIFSIDVAKPSIIGRTPGVDRRVGEVLGGRFEGERLNGRILSGGSDWQAVRSDGTWALDVRFVMETDDNHLIGMTYRGLRHGPKDVIDAIARGEQVNPASYYFRIAPSSRPPPTSTAGSTTSSPSAWGTACPRGRSIRCSRSCRLGRAKR